MRDRLNDPLTHVERCGPVMRSGANQRLTALAEHIPQDFMGVPVEYDLTYESPGDTVTGYRFTDLLTTCVALFPCNTRLATRVITQAVERGPNAIGRAVADQVQAALQDKYQLLQATDAPEVLVVLPGSNVLDKDTIDWGIVERAVREEGAWIKPHPITLKLDMRKLSERFPGRMLDQNSSLYARLASCRKVYFPANSETGLAASLLGKEAVLINGGKWDGIATFVSFYKALSMAKVNAPMRDKIAALFSHPESGLFSAFHAGAGVDMEQWVNRFFLAYQNYPHGRHGELTTARELFGLAA